MSRIAKMPVVLPPGVEIVMEGAALTVTGPQGSLHHEIHPSVDVVRDEQELHCSPRTAGGGADAMAGTTRALIGNMVTGVSEGFEKRLKLVGVGYRAQVQGSMLNLTLGYSHPVEFAIPDGIRIETPSQTDVVIRGIDKQRVGQAAAVIRGFRRPEPYKGKGIKYADEIVVRKEAKKK